MQTKKKHHNLWTVKCWCFLVFVFSFWTNMNFKALKWMRTCPIGNVYERSCLIHRKIMCPRRQLNRNYFDHRDDNNTVHLRVFCVRKAQNRMHHQKHHHIFFFSIRWSDSIIQTAQVVKRNQFAELNLRNKMKIHTQ